MKAETKKTLYGYLIGILSAELVGLLASLFSNTQDTFYTELNQPPFAPPPWVFPIAWVILYAMMGAASYQIYDKKDDPSRKTALVFYIAQLAVNFFWTLVFFRFKALGAAVAVLVLLNVLLILTIFTFRKVKKSAARLMVPYLLWTLFALYLNVGVWVLNP